MTRTSVLAGLLVLVAGIAAAEPLVVHVEHLHSGSGRVVPNAHIVIEGGRFTSVGSAGTAALPEGARKLSGWIATPGFIDAQTSAGLSGLRNVPAVLDQENTVAGACDRRR